jgi:hypothetical protein
LGYHALDEEVLITLYSSNGTNQQRASASTFAVFKSNALSQSSSTTYQFQLLQIEFKLQLDLVVRPQIKHSIGVITEISPKGFTLGV